MSDADMTDFIILDVPECKEPKMKIPTYAEIIMDGTIVFTGSVKFHVASGKAKINIKRHSEKLKAILRSNAKLAPFQFNLYKSESPFKNTIGNCSIYKKTQRITKSSTLFR